MSTLLYGDYHLLSIPTDWWTTSHNPVKHRPVCRNQSACLRLFDSSMVSSSLCCVVSSSAEGSSTIPAVKSVSDCLAFARVDFFSVSCKMYCHVSILSHSEMFLMQLERVSGITKADVTRSGN